MNTMNGFFNDMEWWAHTIMTIVLVSIGILCTTAIIITVLITRLKISKELIRANTKEKELNMIDKLNNNEFK